ncbi:MAG: peptidoglycan-binding protein [Ktedonobacteraceae bacterium]|nr:peptidoglycan-binding protein [Ktedonobacteraceae bacterium]MBA3916455.1 peptidoglycan-binding protein [Terriglobales bacterium]
MAGNQMHLNYNSSLLLKAAIDAGITSPAELAVLMGNAHVETWGFSTLQEKMNYRSAAAIIGAVGSAAERFSRREIENAVSSKDPRQIATILYENRKDLNNTQAGDGWRFHGRGFFQYTGRYNYEKYGRALGVDLVGNPDIAADPEMAAKLAVAYWHHRVPVSKRENLHAAALIINGGENGMEARVVAARAWSNVIDAQLIERIRTGEITPESFQHASTRIRESSEVPVSIHENQVPSHSRHVQSPLVILSVDETKHLQRQLNHLGYPGLHGDPLTIDGTTGPSTEHAIRSFQLAHQLHVDGVAGKDTLAALVDAQHLPLLSEATHPAHLLYMQVMDGIRKLSHGSFGSEDEQRNLAVALTIAAHVGGLKKVDHVVLGTNGVNVFAVQGRLDDPAHLRTHVDRVQSMTHVVDHNSLALQEAVHVHPHQAHVHMQAPPDVGQRATGMEISR